jgi:hypothetical protein
VRICDLGISQITSKLEETTSGKSIIASSRSGSSGNNSDTLGIIGTAPWAPPEASLGHLRPDDPADVEGNEFEPQQGIYGSGYSSKSSLRITTTQEQEYQSAGEAWDVFSLGMLTWYLWYGEMPLQHLKSPNVMMKHLHKGLRPPLDLAPVPPPSLNKLIKAMWQQVISICI